MNSNPMYNDVAPSWDISNDFIIDFSKNIINSWSSHVRRKSSTHIMKMEYLAMLNGKVKIMIWITSSKTILTQ